MSPRPLAVLALLACAAALRAADLDDAAANRLVADARRKWRETGLSDPARARDPDVVVCSVLRADFPGGTRRTDERRRGAEALLDRMLRAIAAASRMPMGDVCPFALTVGPLNSGYVEETLGGETAGAFYLTDDMLRSVADDDELAAVLAHELAHRRLGHPALRAAFGGSYPDCRIPRENEADADALAATYLSRAGYRPEAAATWFDRLARQSPGGCDHPSTPLRAEAARIVAAAGPSDGKKRAEPVRVLGELRALGF